MFDERHKVGPATDVWQFGVLFAKLALGQEAVVTLRPPGWTSFHEFTDKVVGAIEDHGYSRAFVGVLSRCLAPACGGRPTSSELLELVRTSASHGRS
jgi:serine/threonine protein kinase